MKRIMLIEHAPGRADGFLSYHESARPSVELVTWRCYESAVPPSEPYDGLILSGGPMMVGDMAADADVHPFYRHELELIDRAVQDGLPVLGVCLGSQILCHQYGGKVGPKQWVVGWHEVHLSGGYPDSYDKLMAGVSGKFVTFQFHRDHLLQLPPGALPLATSPRSFWEAFRLNKDLMVWGCIFHPEFEVPQAQHVFDVAPKRFSEAGLSRDQLAPVADGQTDRHRMLGNFFGLFVT